MGSKQEIGEDAIKSILNLYGLEETFKEQKEYFNYQGEDGDGYVKIILSVFLQNGKRIVLKILHERGDLLADRAKIEKQSVFSAFMREHGIKTPVRYMANGKYCNEYIYKNIPCNVTVEDWCGEEITEINTEIAYKIGELMARMHILSLENHCEIGCGTRFSAAYWNDVDAFPQFCELCQNEHLDQEIVAQIKKLRDEKLEAIRAVWDTLPKAAVQGDISINNLVYNEEELIVFDYNNAGDEVLISDLVMEGLLTAYEMDLPDGTDPVCREQLFPALLRGYLSVRRLSREEAATAWLAYTLYHALWFSRIVYNEDSLQKLIQKEDYASANRLLRQMLVDMTEQDDGRFRLHFVRKDGLPANEI